MRNNERTPTGVIINVLIRSIFKH